MTRVNRFFLLAAFFLLLPIQLTACDVGAGTDNSSELVCDQDGCKICRGMSCQTYYCNSLSQCPSGFYCNSQSVCRVLSQGGQGQVPGKSDGSQDVVSQTDAEEGPGPECLDDTDCEAMEVCTEGTCVDKPAPLQEQYCVLASDCGATGSCLNGACFFPCSGEGGCPPTLACQSDLCLPSSLPRDQCLFGSDCSFDALCVNAECVPLCDVDAQCPTGTLCGDGVCHPDSTPRAQCRVNTDCSQADSCVNGRCMTPCGDGGQCGEASNCSFGFCMPVFECRFSVECGDDLSCLNGVCTAL